MCINYDFTDLEAFLELFETGSFQLAAGRLNMSQPTLTRRVRKLEDALGTRLFERTTRSVKVTLAGRAFHARAQSLLEDARAAQSALHDGDKGNAARRPTVVTIATVPSATHNLLPDAIRAHMRLGHPSRYRILEGLASETLDLVRDGAADLGISFGGLDDPVLDFRHLRTDRFVLAMPDTHRLIDKDRVKWSDLTGQNLIVPLKGTGNRLLIDNALAGVGISLSWTFEIRNTATMLGMIEAGLGIAPMPVTVLPTQDGTGITYRELAEPQISRSLGIATRKIGGHAPATQSFLDILFTVGQAPAATP
ncbi:MAG: LysR family transcriptional regulator [Pseudomonadota bacterium]